MRNQPKKVIFLASIFCGLLMMTFAFPLINNQVVFNTYYKVWVHRLHNSPELWNRLNAFGGYAIVYSAIFLISAMLLLYNFGGRMSTFRYIMVFLIIMMFCIMLATSFTLYYGKDGVGIF